MHPEVRSDQPGRCPVCGMTLVPASEAPADPSLQMHRHAGGAHSDHTPRHGGRLGTQGDVHVELVVRPDGRHQVFLSDAYRVPILPSRTTGSSSLGFEPASGGTASASPMRAEDALGALVATHALPTEAGTFRVRVAVAGETIAMDF